MAALNWFGHPQFNKRTGVDADHMYCGFNFCIFLSIIVYSVSVDNDENKGVAQVWTIVRCF